MMAELKREILDLIESPELYAYLIAHTNRLKIRDYVSIIAGAPVGLDKKQKLLYNLELMSDLEEQEIEYLKLCSECMNRAIHFLTVENETIFLIQLMGYDDDNHSDVMDGPYIATSFEGVKRAVQNYYDEDPGPEWQTLYWRIEAYLGNRSGNTDTDFLSPEYTYIMDKDGEVQYFIHESRPMNRLKGVLGRRAEDTFNAALPNLNVPVPYQPGDVLCIDCRPYTPGAFYCVLKEVGDDCCGIQCEYMDSDGNMETGALKHGDYFPNFAKVHQYLSPLYRAKLIPKDGWDWDKYRRSQHVSKTV